MFPTAEVIAQISRGETLAEAFASRRRGQWWCGWFGSGGIVMFLLCYLLGLMLVASTAVAILGLIVLATAFFTIFTTESFVSLWVVLSSLGAIIVVLLANKVLIALLRKAIHRQHRAEHGLPYWVTDLFSPGMGWRESATEVLLTGQSGVSILTAVLAERGARCGRTNLLSILITTALFLGITWAVFSVSVSFRALAPVAVTLFLASTIGWLQERDMRLPMMEQLYRWDSPDPASRLYADSGIVARGILMFCVILPFAFLGTYILFQMTGMTGVIVAGCLSLLGTIVVSLAAARGNISRVRFPPNESPRVINGVFERFVAQELLEDIDGLRLLPAQTLPNRTEWLYPWEMILDLASFRRPRKKARATRSILR